MVLYTDSTHLKANANKNKFVEDTVKVVSEQCLLTATENMKKIANILWKRDMRFLGAIIKHLIYTTQTRLKMVGLSVV